MRDSEPSKLLILMTEQAVLYLNVVIEKSFQLISNNVCLKINQSKSQHKKANVIALIFLKKLMLSLKLMHAIFKKIIIIKITITLTQMIIMCF